MVSKSLMLWDWVSLRNEPYKIGALSSQSVTLKGYKPSGVLIDCNDIEPIPLTTDILRANFTQGAMDSFYFADGVEIYVTEDGVEICIHFDNSSLDHHCIYVHELQRALRCCGLWDLADNFKVRK